MSVETKTTLAFFNPQTGEEYHFSKDRILIGRHENCDIVLRHESISEYHALLLVDENMCCTIMDLKSHNGTFVNGLRIPKDQYISLSDKVRVGNLLLEINETYSEEHIYKDHVQVNNVQEERIYTPEKISEDAILIDDEYCDIVFKDDNFKPYLY
jgi:pSer/pThr/pTyr-binding forkhead associated (FHA) protein